MKIYLDNCCYGRPYDDQSYDEIRKEAGAVQNIVKQARWYGHIILSSDTLDTEISAIRTDDKEKYNDIWSFYRRTATKRVTAQKAIFDYFAPLALHMGVRGADVLHLCFAISAGADYLVTTDKKFIKAAARLALPIKVINPLNFPLGGMV